jgi:hypothetical protein
MARTNRPKTEKNKMTAKKNKTTKKTKTTELAKTFAERKTMLVSRLYDIYYGFYVAGNTRECDRIQKIIYRLA